MMSLMPFAYSQHHQRGLASHLIFHEGDSDCDDDDDDGDDEGNADNDHEDVGFAVSMLSHPQHH